MAVKIRESNFEIMRIISMLMIIFWHILLHGEIIGNTSPDLKIILIFIQAIICVHVNSFVLVSGYFMSKSKINKNKIINLFLQTWFYKVVIVLILLCMGLITVTNIEFIKVMSPLVYGGNWFIVMYLILMCLSPFLNKLIDNIDKKSYQKLLLILFILFSIIPTIGAQEIYNNSRGYSIENFVLLYLIGGYLRRYPMQLNYIFKPMSTKVKKLIFSIIILLLSIFSTAMVYFAYSIENINELTYELYKIIMISFNSYDSPIVIIQSIIYFSLFSLFTLKSKIINYISTLLLGIYLIHDNRYLRPIIYKELFDYNENIYNVDILMKIIVTTLIIFIVCGIIEIIRKEIFKQINSLVFKKEKNYLTK